jgi:hypothetical protein
MGVSRSSALAPIDQEERNHVADHRDHQEAAPSLAVARQPPAGRGQEQQQAERRQAKPPGDQGHGRDAGDRQLDEQERGAPDRREQEQQQIVDRSIAAAQHGWRFRASPLARRPVIGARAKELRWRPNVTGKLRAVGAGTRRLLRLAVRRRLRSEGQARPALDIAQGVAQVAGVSPRPIARRLVVPGRGTTSRRAMGRGDTPGGW